MLETTQKYCRWVGIDIEKLREINKDEWNKRIWIVQDILWEEELGRKTTFELYMTSTGGQL